MGIKTRVRNLKSYPRITLYENFTFFRMMKFLFLTIALANAVSLTVVNGISEIYDSRDLWYGGEKLTITVYEKQGIGYLRMKGVHNWGLQWEECNASVQNLIREKLDSIDGISLNSFGVSSGVTIINGVVQQSAKSCVPVYSSYSKRHFATSSTIESTDPLTTEENDFLDNIERKIHQTAAENEERARQRQIQHEKDMKALNDRLERERIQRENAARQRQIQHEKNMKALHNRLERERIERENAARRHEIQHEKDMKALHDRLERERIEREKQQAQFQANLQASLAPLNRPCFPFCN